MGEAALNISNIMRQRLFFHEYQPLWNTETEEIFAYEALIRTSPIINPVLIFHFGRERGVLYEFDIASITNAIKEYPESYYQKYHLFINIFPSTLVHPDFPTLIRGLVQDYPLISGKVVFEINEEPLESMIWDADTFVERINLLRELEFLVALDDLRLSSVSEKKILKYSPDFVKLDRSCSRDLAHSINKQKAIHSLLTKSEDNVVIVLEGIENEEDLITASRLGIPAVQGYYISRPRRL
jgi:EAL domain-containing protein (putative c-di-GMP-specific phosphodiesterase class I)